MRLPLRSTVLWAHLVCGVAVAAVGLMMSATGVVLIYERQMAPWADREYWTGGETAPLPSPAAARLLERQTPVERRTPLASVNPFGPDSGHP